MGRNLRVATLLITLLLALSTASSVVVPPAAAQRTSPRSAAFVSGSSRIVVYQTEFVNDGAEYGLSTSQDAGWAVSVVDVTNFGTVPQTFLLSNLQMTIGGEDASIAASSSSAPSAQLGFAEVQSDGAVTVPVDSTARLAVAFPVPGGNFSGQGGFQQDLVLGLDGEQTSVRFTVVDQLDAGALPQVQPWTGLQGVIQTVLGNGAIEVSVGGNLQTVQVAGVRTPPVEGCYGAESSEAVTSLSGGSVWVEVDPTSDGSLVWYWDGASGHLALLNQTLVEQGFAAYDLKYDESAYAQWLSAKSGPAKASKTGLWADCTGAGGEWINPPTPTPVPTKTADEIRAEYTWIDIRDLAIRPQQFEGQKVAFQGEVFNVPTGQTGSVFEFQVWVITATGDREAIYVYMQGDASGIYEGTFVTVYGVGDGYVTGTNAFGGQITQALVRAVIVDR